MQLVQGVSPCGPCGPLVGPQPLDARVTSESEARALYMRHHWNTYHRIPAVASTVAELLPTVY